MRSKNVSWDVPLTFKSRVYGPAKEETQEYDVGVFKAYVVFFLYIQSVFKYFLKLKNWQALKLSSTLHYILYESVPCFYHVYDIVVSQGCIYKHVLAFFYSRSQKTWCKTFVSWSGLIFTIVRYKSLQYVLSCIIFTSPVSRRDNILVPSVCVSVCCLQVKPKNSLWLFSSQERLQMDRHTDTPVLPNSLPLH